MASNKYTYNQVYTVSLNKKALTELVAQNDLLSKKDLRVCLILFTKLDGFKVNDNPDITASDKRLKVDPLNYSAVDIGAIAETLGLKKKEVRKSIETLVENGILEEGSNTTVTNGYRFTF